MEGGREEGREGEGGGEEGKGGEGRGRGGARLRCGRSYRENRLLLGESERDMNRLLLGESERDRDMEECGSARATESASKRK